MRRYEYFDFLIVLAKSLAMKDEEFERASFGQDDEEEDVAVNVAPKLEHIIKCNLLPNTRLAMRGEPFRCMSLWSSTVNQTLASYHSQLALIHHILSETALEKRHFTIDSAHDLREKVVEVPI